jgi:hypothetical protein
MFTSRPLRTTAAVAALVLSLAACGASQDESPTAPSDGGGLEATEPAQEAPAASDDGGDEGAGSDDGTSADEDPDAADQETGTLTITLDGEETSFTPEIVRCEGEPGTLRNAVLTMKGDELPLVKVAPGEFALVKLQQRGEPEKTSSPQDITAEDGRIVFDDATIGGATVDGTVECLQGNQS